MVPSLFELKKHGNDDKLQLKSRPTPAETLDKDNDDICEDSSTVQFVIIRLILSLFTILQFSIATL